MEHKATDLPLENIIAAILFIADEPVTLADLSQVLDRGEEEIFEICTELENRFSTAHSGIVLVRSSEGYQFVTAPQCCFFVEKFLQKTKTRQLSRAALEILAIIAYKEPVSRADINAIRGVNSDATLRSLIQKGFVENISSRRSSVAGGTTSQLFRTTKVFLEKMGIESLHDLPDLSTLLPGMENIEDFVTQVEKR